MVWKEEILNENWVTWAIIFYFTAVVLIVAGIDRISGYEMSELSFVKDRHVYVGGDAYNYIINANLQTGYFVLAGVLLIMGTLMIITGAIIKEMNKLKLQVDSNLPKAS